MILADLKLAQIIADDSFNCRGVITPISVGELAKSIEADGLLQPVTVAPEKDGQYRLIVGFRRYLAHKLLKLKTIKTVILSQVLEESEYRILNLTENLQRVNLNILQEAKALAILSDLGLPISTIAKKLGTSSPWVKIRINLLQLPAPIQTEAAAGLITQKDIDHLHRVFLDHGIDHCLEEGRNLKTQNQTGVKNTKINLALVNTISKNNRSRAEINTLKSLMYDQLGPNLATRCLAWAVGEISLDELYGDLEEEAKSRNKLFVRPT